MSLFTVNNDSLVLRLKAGQMTTSTLGKIFNIYPTSLFLIGSDGTVATPDEEGDFETYDLCPDVEWTVNGDSSKPHSSSQSCSGRNSPYAYQQPSSPPPNPPKSGMLTLNRNKPPGVARQEIQTQKAPGRSISETWTKTIEVCSYEDNVLKKTLNLPITLSEKTASVSHVGEIVSMEAFEEVVILLDNDNLKIPNSAGTRGK